MTEEKKPLVFKIEGEAFEKFKKFNQEHNKQFKVFSERRKALNEEISKHKDIFWDQVSEELSLSKEDFEKDLHFNDKYEDAGFYLVEEKYDCGLDSILGGILKKAS